MPSRVGAYLCVSGITPYEEAHIWDHVFRVGYFFNLTFIILHAPLLCSNTTCIHVVFTYYLLLSTYSIYRLVSYIPCLDYTLYFVQFYVVREFFEVFVELYTKFISTHWPFF
jgi:hypothetical protein